MEWEVASETRWHVVVRELSSIEARLEVWGAVPAAWRAQPWTGKLHGPYQFWGQTLKMHRPLRPLKPVSANGPWLGLTIPEPTTWTPDSPAWYEIQLSPPPPVTPEAERSLASPAPSAAPGPPTGAATANVPDLVRLRVGLKLIAARRRAFYWEGKRWVLRGLTVDGISWSSTPPEMFRESCFTLVVEPTALAELAAASDWGIPTLVNLTSLGPAEGVQAASNAAQWPAVLGVVVGATADLAELRRVAPNLLVLRYLAAELLGKEPADGYVVDETRLSDVDPHTVAGPLLALRTQASAHDWSTARQEIDRLQAALSPRWDLAGYLALPPGQLRA